MVRLGVIGPTGASKIFMRLRSFIIINFVFLFFFFFSFFLFLFFHFPTEIYTSLSSVETSVIDSKLQHSVQNYFNSRSNIFRKLTHGHKIRVLRNFNAPHLSVTDMAPSHCSCSSAATPVALPRAYASSVGSGIVVIRRRPAAVRTLRLPFRRQRTLNRPYAMQTYSFYRAACNADAVL